MIRRLAALLALAMTLMLTGSTSAHAAGQTVCFFGDSISLKGAEWDPGWPGWTSIVGAQAVADGLTVRNLAVGGMAFHQGAQAATPGNAFGPYIDQLWRNEPGLSCQVAVVSGGTNDAAYHQVGAPNWSGRHPDYMLYAMADVYWKLKAHGVQRVVWNTVYPWSTPRQSVCCGGVIPLSLVPPANATAAYANAWLKALFGSGRSDTVVVDTHDVMTAPWAPSQGNQYAFIDGYHPTHVGHQYVALAFPERVLDLTQPATGTIRVVTASPSGPVATR